MAGAPLVIARKALKKKLIKNWSKNFENQETYALRHARLTLRRTNRIKRLVRAEHSALADSQKDTRSRIVKVVKINRGGVAGIFQRLAAP